MATVSYEVKEIEGVWKVSGDTLEKPTYPRSKGAAIRRLGVELSRLAKDGCIEITVTYPNGGKAEAGE